MWWKVESGKGRGRWLLHFRLGGCVYGFRRHRGVNDKSHEEFVFLYGAKINYIPNSIRKTWPSSFDDNAKKKLHPTINDAPLRLLLKGKVRNIIQYFVNPCPLATTCTLLLLCVQIHSLPVSSNPIYPHVFATS
jgi:hypothetical protein